MNHKECHLRVSRILRLPMPWLPLSLLKMFCEQEKYSSITTKQQNDKLHLLTVNDFLSGEKATEPNISFFQKQNLYLIALSTWSKRLIPSKTVWRDYVTTFKGRIFNWLDNAKSSGKLFAGYSSKDFPVGGTICPSIVPTTDNTHQKEQTSSH